METFNPNPNPNPKHETCKRTRFSILVVRPQLHHLIQTVQENYGIFYAKFEGYVRDAIRFMKRFSPSVQKLGVTHIASQKLHRYDNLNYRGTILKFGPYTEKNRAVKFHQS